MLYGPQKLRCPVCPKELLGSRNKAFPFEGFCNDCQFYYYFPPHSSVPTKAQSAKSRANVCKCASCKARDITPLSAADDTVS